MQKYNRYLILAFDCLFVSGEDIRGTSSILTRLQRADEVISNCFVRKDEKGSPIPTYKGAFSLPKIQEFHKEKIKEHIDSINHDLALRVVEPLIRRKYFIPVLGGNPCEVFAYTCLIWESYVVDSKCQYELDGVIYHPLEQKYTTKQRESRWPEYKWKPEDKNSIDFYVTIRRDKNTKLEYEVFDNTNSVSNSVSNNNNSVSSLVNTPYKICYLNNGRLIRGAERPVPFREEEGLNVAHVPIVKGEIRDASGNIIQDETVVEFGYINDMSINKESRWVPIRVRKDKTELLRKTGKGYGNFNIVADGIWKSMIGPITLEDIRSLTNPKTYLRNIARLRTRVDHSTIISERRDNLHQQAVSSLTKTMRGFHNWVKSQLIYTYVNKAYTRGVKQRVLDIGCGRGVDIMKFYYTMVELYVGIDTNASFLLSTVDSAKSRYEQLQKTHPGFPRMLFIQADAGSRIDYESQRRALGQVSNLNRGLLEQFLTNSKPYDRVNCQFSIQNFLSDNLRWANFCTNVSTLLKPGGLMIVTCIDGDIVTGLLEGKDKYNLSYTTEKGERKTLLEIIKKYGEKNTSPGLCVDFYSLLENREGEYTTKYLPVKGFILDSFRSYGLELVETDLFKDHYAKSRYFFTGPFQYEENSKTRDFFTEVSKYYGDRSETDDACFKVTSLYRYYIFRRSETPQKGGGITDYSFQFEIFSALKDSGLVPKKASELEFYDNLDIKLVSDRAINDEYIEKVSRSIVIEHDTKNGTVVELDGLGVYVINVERGILRKYGPVKHRYIVLLKSGYTYSLVKYPRLAPVFNSKDISIKTIMNRVL